MKRSTLTLSSILMLMIALPVRADEPKPEDQKPIVVPFTLMPTGHFLVTVKMNDKGPYKLIFDTGAPTMLVNNRAAKDSGILKKGARSPLFSPFGSMGQVNIDVLEIGGVKAEKVPATIMDHPTVQIFSDHFKKEHGPIDGIVGFPFFARYRMTVDYQKKELTFVPNGYKPADVVQSMMNAMMASSNSKGLPKIVSPAAQWGFVAGKDTDDEKAGVDVRSVSRDGPAARGGLKVGDRILTIDGRWTDSIGDTYAAAGFVKPGRKVTVVVEREGKEVKLSITPANGL